MPSFFEASGDRLSTIFQDLAVGLFPPTASHTVDGVAISRLDVVRRWTERATIVPMLLLARLSRMGPQSQRYGYPAV